MTVTVKLFASLRAGRFEVRGMDFPADTSVGQAIAAAGVRPEEAAVVFVNSRHADPEMPLAEGDTLAIFPPVGGG
jgi:molybdopterin converting factor small subunit